jgi:hypothetical protein
MRIGCPEKLSLQRRRAPVILFPSMVDVAQLAEHWVVAPVVEGSSPFIHPIIKIKGLADIA